MHSARPFRLGRRGSSLERNERGREHAEESLDAIAARLVVRAADARHRRRPGHPAAGPRRPRRLEPGGPRAGGSSRLERADRGGVRHGQQADDPGRAGPSGGPRRHERRRRPAVHLFAQQRHARHRVPARHPRRGAAADGGVRQHGRPDGRPHGLSARLPGRTGRRRGRRRPRLRLDHAGRNDASHHGGAGARRPRPGRRDPALARPRRQRGAGRRGRRGRGARPELGGGQRALARETWPSSSRRCAPARASAESST